MMEAQPNFEMSHFNKNDIKRPINASKICRKVFEKKFLRKIFVSKREDATERRKLHNKELYNL